MVVAAERRSLLTGHSYTAGKSEIAMGKAIKKYGWKRSDLVISTKVSAKRSASRLPGSG